MSSEPEDGGALPPGIETLLVRTEAAAAALGAAAERREWTAAGAHDAALAQAVAALGAALARAEPHVIRAAAARLGTIQTLHGAALESLRRAHAGVRDELQTLAARRRVAASYLAAQEQDGDPGR
ncbi:MAG TPA: hypothetical protein VF339_02660 [Gammaproteobacteria bacterium]